MRARLHICVAACALPAAGAARKVVPRAASSAAQPEGLQRRIFSVVKGGKESGNDRSVTCKTAGRTGMSIERGTMTCCQCFQRKVESG